MVNNRLNQAGSPHQASVATFRFIDICCILNEFSFQSLLFAEVPQYLLTRGGTVDTPQQESGTVGSSPDSPTKPVKLQPSEPIY